MLQISIIQVVLQLQISNYNRVTAYQQCQPLLFIFSLRYYSCFMFLLLIIPFQYLIGFISYLFLVLLQLSIKLILSFRISVFRQNFKVAAQLLVYNILIIPVSLQVGLLLMYIACLFLQYLPNYLAMLQFLSFKVFLFFFISSRVCV